jgi:predicted short-subunit dehydrogenase-like oxidoreductase (DUF2520 family)
MAVPVKARSNSSTSMNIVFVGAGRLATQLAKALHAKGHAVAAVYSRTLDSAQALGTAVSSPLATDSIASLPLQADAFIIAVKDDALPGVAAQLAAGRQGQTFLHTAGSVHMSVLAAVKSHGVIYPMQTFSKERHTDFSRIPIFIEGSTPEALATARSIASAVSCRVVQMTSSERRHLHLAAVFACNFANHCYALAADILESHGMSFDDMLPLIDETAAKVHHMHPRLAQTGPAVRYDESIIKAQQELLADKPTARQVYAMMSRSIHKLQQEP